MTPVPTSLRRTRACVAALAALGALAAAAPARADQTGGLVVPGPPEVTSAACAQRAPWTCVRGQVLTLRGANLGAARAIVFLGGPGKRDDVRVRLRARAARSGSLVTVVPRRARSGGLRVESVLGARTVSPRSLTILAAPPATDDAGGGSRLVAGGRRQAELRYTLTGDPGAGAAVEAVRAGDGEVVRRWRLGDGVVRWDGFVGDEPAPTGTYALRLNAAGAAVASVEPGSDTEFDLIEGLYPIRGAHTAARTETQRFGGGRGHQGTDHFARCGTPLAAFTKGVVHFTGFHGRAGNYVVVNMPNGESFAYMHLQDRPLVRKGETVFAGQRLGYVGDTGRASGCHLHIELWSAPGWYQGGRAYDSLPLMQRLDRWS